MSDIKFQKLKYNKKYESFFDAPIVEKIRIIHPESQRSATILATIDTGSDVSTVPATILFELEIKKSPQPLSKENQGNDMALILVKPRYTAIIEVCGKQVEINSATAGSDDYARLGRDVLHRSQLEITWVGEGNNKIKVTPLSIPKGPPSDAAR